jgi:hypothetical protein
MKDKKQPPVEQWEDWLDSTYRTGGTQPPKSRGGLIAFLLVMVIFLCGVSTALGLMNIRLFRQLSEQSMQKEAPVVFSSQSAQAITDEVESPLGFMGQTVPDFWRNYYHLPKGVYVTEVFSGSQACSQGIHPGDILVAFNGVSVPVEVDGTYVDDAIATVRLPKIEKGENELIIRLRYGNIDSVESYYILGNFGVEVHGYYARITALPECLYFESITNQKMGFYGGNLKYSFKMYGGGKKTLEISKYRGAVIKVLVDGEEKGYIDFPPHRLCLGELTEGEHTVELILYGNRMNTFGQLHKTDEHLAWTGPDSWRTKGRFWTDEYMLTRTGILTAPRILTEE